MDIKTFYSRIFNVFKKEVNEGVDKFKQAQQTRAQQKAERQSQPLYAFTNDEQWMAYFREILAQEFSQYTIHENVPVQSLVGDVADTFTLYPSRPQQVYKAEWGLPYSFVFFKDDRVYGVLLLAKANKNYKQVKFLVSKMYAKKMGVPFISFYMDAPNEREYVIDRVHEFMG